MELRCLLSTYIAPVASEPKTRVISEILAMFQFGRASSATRYVSAFFRNLSVRSHAVLAHAGSYTSGQASFMKA